MKKIFVAGLVLVGAMNVLASPDGIQLSASRIIYEEGTKAVNFSVTNEYNLPALASGIVVDAEGKPTADFSVSPSLFQIQPKSTAQNQVLQLKPITTDTEKMYMLRVRTILSDNNTVKDNEPSGTLQFAIEQNIKLFYRPKTVTENFRGAAENLKWEKTVNGLKAMNDSKVSVTLVSVTSCKRTERIAETLAPLSSKEWSIKFNCYDEATFKYIDEYGNAIDHKLNVQ